MPFCPTTFRMVPEAPVLAASRQDASQVVAAARSCCHPCLILGLLLASFLGLQTLLPLGTAIKIGADEGFELSKATLCQHNFKLYTEIWNDQPPLNTSILLDLIHRVSPPILGPRLLSVGLALLLLSSFFILLNRLHGVLVAGLGTALLLASPGFIELSSSCMQEVPALAPIIAALCLLVALPAARWPSRELLAGALFGLGLQFKLIGVIYLPLAILISFFPSSRLRCSNPIAASTFKAAIRSSSILLATAAATFLGLNWLTGNPLLLQLQQSWAAHFSSAKSFAFGSPADHPFDWTVLPRNWDTTLPALVGTFVLLLALRRSKPSPSALSPAVGVCAAKPPAIGCSMLDVGCSMFPRFMARAGVDGPSLPHFLPLAWLALTLVVFTTHKPWWSYYYLHNSVPLCWCAAIGFVWLGRYVSKPATPALAHPRTALIRARSWTSRITLWRSAVFRGPRDLTLVACNGGEHSGSRK
jgi:hypothetical protein